EALGDKVGVTRYGSVLLPMDEALVQVAVDLSGRPFLAITVPEGLPPIGDFPVQLIEEFLRAFVTNAQLTLHLSVLAGKDSHHICEAAFKGVARALLAATTHHPRIAGVPSTKGVL
ncbi:MAG: imidazoleglycerol-phosphate dehydratase, partial [Verrucomicrobiia bacterium]